MRRKKQLLSLATIVVLILFTGFVAVSSGADVMVSPANDSLLGKYENSNRIFKRSVIGDKIVYFHQRTIKGTIVENDYILYQFDKVTRELLKKDVHWRSDLPEDLPTAMREGETQVPMTRQEAESMVTGQVKFSELIIISKNSDVFAIENPPAHPCWVVRSVKDGNIIVTIIDAVTGEFLGDGVPPPQVTGFSFSGPIYFNPCRSTWAGWYENAADWFEEMGYPTEAVAWPNKEKLRSNIESTETAVFYEIAHGGSYGFSNGCIDGAWSDYTHSSDIENWIANYPKMPFTFIASCGGMCTTAPGTFSHAFRKGSEENTATVGYCHMDASYCSSCWGGSIVWQDTFFQYMNTGYTVVEAYNEAMAMRPQCFEPQGYGSCMRHAGDADFTLYPAVSRIPEIEVEVDIKPGSYPNSINPRSKGKIPVAILSSMDFDAPTEVDTESLTFGPTGDEESLAFCNRSPEDVDDDGYDDLICHFYTQNVEFQCGDNEGILIGMTVDETPLKGSDSVRIVPSACR